MVPLKEVLNNPLVWNNPFNRVLWWMSGLGINFLPSEQLALPDFTLSMPMESDMVP
jgi:hypothetical protein